jgi:mono/diheme cytochrome c family protein
LSVLRRPLLALAIAALIVLPVMYAVGNRSEGGTGPIAAPVANGEAQIERGRYLATAGNCAGCHTAPGGAFMAGGLAFETPFGTVYATNITPDRETGIGDWSERDFLNAMRHGVRPDGAHLYPVFPYTAYTKVRNEDVAAIFAWLKSLAPVRAETPPNKLRFPFAFRPLLAFWKAAYFERGPMHDDPSQEPKVQRGAYLVEALAHCGACHSPRNFLGAVQKPLAMSGGVYLDRVPSGAHRPWSAPNLTASDRGLGLWSAQDLVAYLATGRNAFLESFGPMNEVIVGSTRHLARQDIEAMAAYLTSLPLIDAAVHEAQVPDRRVLGRGRTVYNLHCGTCHLPTGLGDTEMAPRLDRGSLVVQSIDPAAMINVILYGPASPPPPSPWREPMDDFQYLLDDEEIAAVATFVRSSWGNDAPPVSPAQVARQR